MFIQLPCFPKSHLNPYFLLGILINWVIWIRWGNFFFQSIRLKLIVILLNFTFYFLAFEGILCWNVQELRVYFNWLEVCGLLQYNCIFICQDHSIVLLNCLLLHHQLDVDIRSFNLNAIKFKGFVNRIEVKRIFQHCSSLEFDKQMSSHVVSQVSHYYRSALSFFNWRTWNPEEINVSVNVHLAIPIIHNIVCRHYLAFACVEMEESLEIVYVWSYNEIRRSQIDSEPVWDRRILVSHKTVGFVFVYLHVNTKCCWIEVNHNILFLEAQTFPSSADNLWNVLVNCLFYVEIRRFDLINMLLDILKRLDTFFQQ